MPLLSATDLGDTTAADIRFASAGGATARTEVR